MIYKADTVGNSSLHSLHVSSLSASLVSSLMWVSALPGGWSSFSLRGLWTRLQELTGKLTVMMEGLSGLFQSLCLLCRNTDPTGNHTEISHECVSHWKGMFHMCTLMITAPVSSLLSAVLSLLLHTTDSQRTCFDLEIRGRNWNPNWTVCYNMMSTIKKQSCITDMAFTC